MLFSKRKKTFKYSDLSSREQKTILKKSVHKANEEQRSIVQEFDKRFYTKHAN